MSYLARTDWMGLKFAKFLLFVMILSGIGFGQTWIPSQILTASNKGVGDNFGWSVSLIDSYALIGAPFVFIDGVDAGAAYIFVHSGTRWTEQAILTASDKGVGDNFGWSVSLIDSYALIGAPFVVIDGVDAGAAYIFVRSGTRWTEQAILAASNKSSFDWFGCSVSLIENYALVGGLNVDFGLIEDAGAAYVFVRSGTRWNEQAILRAREKRKSSNFGNSVSLTENYALIGAYFAGPDGVKDAGAAYIFSRNGTIWTEQVVLTASNKEFGDKFGSSVSITENYALVGAYQCYVPFNCDDHGVAYIFARSGTIWSEQAILTASNKEFGDKFGSSVSLTDNYALVGASESNHAYTFMRVGTAWIETFVSDTGASVALSRTESFMMIGSFGEAVDGIPNAGIVQVFVISGT